VLTDELIELAGGDEDLVLGVLAHEIGHVDHDHSLRQLYRAAGITTLIMLIGGDIGSGAEDVLVQGTAVLALSYSRAAERDADRYSVELMHRIGRDPAAIARFFELLRDKLGDNSQGDFLSSHPATPERIEETRRYANEVAKGTSGTR
jgi:predicted Zn-dependent protease